MLSVALAFVEWKFQDPGIVVVVDGVGGGVGYANGHNFASLRLNALLRPESDSSCKKLI